MTSAFQWQGLPSEIGQSHITRRPAKVPDLAPKRLHTFAAADASDASLEAQIKQVNREVEHHFACAQTVVCDVMRGYHRDEARRLAAKVRELVKSRSPGYVAQIEAERGLA